MLALKKHMPHFFAPFLILPLFLFLSPELTCQTNPDFRNPTILEELINPPQSSGAVRFKVESLGNGKGLNSSDISALFQDKDGYIWVGNKPGISRFDGYEFENFTKAGGIYIGQIHSIAEDHTGTLWVGGINGLFFYKNGEFHPTLIKQHDIRILHFDDNKNIWVGGMGFIPYKFSFSDLEKIKKGKNINIQAFVNKNIWNEEVGINEVWDIDTDSEGNAWFAIKNRGVSFDGKQFLTHWIKRTSSTGYSVVASITPDSVYWGSEKAGLIFQKNNSFKKLTEPDTYIFEITDSCSYFLTPIELLKLKNGQLTSLYVFTDYGHLYFKEMILDREGNFWIGAEGNLLKLTPSYFKTWGIDENRLLGLNYSIAELPSGKILIGCNKEKVLTFKNNDFQLYTELDVPSGSFTGAIYPDYKGWTWYGTSMNGIIRQRDGISEKYNMGNGLGDNGQYFFYKDKKGELWSGGEHGISHIIFNKNNEIEFENYFTEQAEGYFQVFHNIVESPNGTFWVASDKGFFFLKDKQLIRWNFPAPNPPHPIITGLISDAEGHIWLSTQGDGLWQCYFNENNEPTLKKQWSKKDGLLDNVILNVLEDKKNRIWAISQSGICCMDFQNDETQIKCYDQRDGWPDVPTFQYQFLESQDGMMWAVSSTTVTVFRLYDLPINQVKPYSFINQVQLFGGKEDIYQYAQNSGHDNQLPRHLILPHNKNFLRFHFTATSHTIAEKNKFRYKLEGLDVDWNEARQSRTIPYPGLQPGNYIFKVLAANNDGIWGEHAATFSFEILAPWYRTWWAYLMGLILFFGIVFIIYKSQLSKKLAKQESHRLKELDTFKTRFYSNITHEFRTPLTVIQGMADELEKHPQKESQKKLSLIKKNSHRLLALINQMLELSKLKAGKGKLDIRQDDIIGFIKYLVEAFESFAKSKNVGLQFYSEEKYLEMDFDAKKMEQVLTNLISNAVKFTPEFGKIIVVAKRNILSKKPTLEIQVKDSGIGISPIQLPYIFDRFHQANPTYENQGSGIGLALVKELMEILNGKIKVESIPNIGTTFSIIFPIQNKASRIIETKHLQIDQAFILENQKEGKEFLIENGLPLLLIIEDNADVIFYLETCLENDYQILIGRNGKDGIEKAIELLPDIIISDVMMPEMGGFEVCATLKEDERTNHIPIILLTAKATSEDKLEGLSYGADAYLIKPFEKAELIIRLNKLLEIRKTLQKKYSSNLISSQVHNIVIENKEDSFIEKTEKIILSHLVEDFSIQELARELHLSRSQVHRKIKALTGMSTGIYIRHIRLQRAKELLASTKLSISEIAYQVGFKTPVYFSQVYKETFGKSPSATRK